jgi:hypothetical protein
VAAKSTSDRPELKGAAADDSGAAGSGWATQVAKATTKPAQ